MRLLDRYLLRELLVPLCYCLCGFLLLWVASDLVTELSALQDKRLHAGDIADYYLVKTPEFLVMVLPIALLLALLCIADEPRPAQRNHGHSRRRSESVATGPPVFRGRLAGKRPGFWAE